MKKWHVTLTLTAAMVMSVTFIMAQNKTETQKREVTDGATKVAIAESLTPEGCTRVEFELPSKSMGRSIKVAMVLPPNFKTDDKAAFPFLYALHGYGAPYDTFTHMSPLRKVMVKHPMVLVCFSGDKGSWYLNSTVKKDSQFETFFFDELIPFVEKAFRGNGRRAVTGFSMGGFGAFHYMLNKPEMFTSVSSLSGAFRRPENYEKRILNGLEPLLGKFDAKSKAYHVVNIPARMEDAVAAEIKIPPMLFTCGTSDFLLDANREFRDLLVKLNGQIQKKLSTKVADVKDARAKSKALGKLMLQNQLNFIYAESPGGHNWTYWMNASEGIGLFHAKYFEAAAKK